MSRSSVPLWSSLPFIKHLLNLNMCQPETARYWSYRSDSKKLRPHTPLEPTSQRESEEGGHIAVCVKALRWRYKADGGKNVARRWGARGGGDRVVEAEEGSKSKFVKAFSRKLSLGSPGSLGFFCLFF